MFFALAANQKFELVFIDIRAAFLQSKPQDREVFLEPPSDLIKPGLIWKLIKLLYGLDDASRRFLFKNQGVF